MRYILIAVCFLAFSSLGYSQESRADAFDFYRAGQCDKAIPILEKTLVADKKDIAARVYLGGCYLKLGRKDEARKTLKGMSMPSKGLADGLDTKVTMDRKDRGRFAQYTEEARSSLTNGSVLLVIEVKSDGKVGLIYVIRELPFGLTDSSIAAASRTRWVPASKYGKNVDAITIREYTFSIN